MKRVNSEDPNLHWEYVNVSGKRVLDLGCGDFGNACKLPYPTTLEYFLSNGAAFVLGVDSNAADLTAIASLKETYSNFNIVGSSIVSSSQIEELIINNNIDIVKSDIEGAEIHLFDLADEAFCKIEEYYIETHGAELYNRCIEKLTKNNYNIYESIDLIHTHGYCKVLFAKKG